MQIVTFCVSDVMYFSVIHQ